MHRSFHFSIAEFLIMAFQCIIKDPINAQTGVKRIDKKKGKISGK